MRTCVDLRTLAGERYRLAYDPAYQPARKEPDLWMLTMPCRYGIIYPAGDDRLRVDVNGHIYIAARVAALLGCVLVQDGDHEKTVEFPVATFPAVADIVKPRKRWPAANRQQRARLLALSIEHSPLRRVKPSEFPSLQPVDAP